MSEGNEDLGRETLNAYCDGELPAEEMTRIAALLEKRPDLRAYVEGQERLRRHLHESFAPLMNEPIAQRLQALVTSSSNNKRATVVRERLREFFTWNVVGPAAATLAAGLLVGIVVERVVPEPGPFVGSASTGQILAEGALAHALDDQLASNPQSGQHVQIGLSFRSRQGRDCRTFVWNGDAQSTSGIACRFGADWRVAVLASQTRRVEDRATYQMAGASMPNSIRDAVSAMISGQPFGPDEERAARAAHWAGAGRK